MPNNQTLMTTNMHRSRVIEPDAPSHASSFGFPFFSRLPCDIQLGIFHYLTVKELCKSSSVSKTWCTLSGNTTLWQKWAFPDKNACKQFIKTITHPLIRQLIVSGEITRHQADQVNQLLQSERYQKGRFSVLHRRALQSLNGIKGLAKRLLTLQEIETLEAAHLFTLFSDNGIRALTEGLLTYSQVQSLSPVQLQYLLSPSGMVALINRYITPEQVSTIRNSLYLEHLFSEAGLTALGNQDITVEAALQLPTVTLFHHLRSLTVTERSLLPCFKR